MPTNPSGPIPIWLVFGGRSSEHDISMSSGRTACLKLDRQKFALHPVVIRRDGQWAIPTRPFGPDETEQDLDALISGETGHARAHNTWSRGAASQIELMSAGEAAARARRDGIRAALLVLHGRFGEDGTIQGMFEMEDVPYVGSGVLASALAMDKTRCQRFFGAYGLPVAPFVSRTIDLSDLQRNAESFAFDANRAIGAPCVVKPARDGSSVGVGIVREPEQLASAIQNAAQYDSLVMVEKFLAGQELTCGVIELRLAGGHLEPHALPITMIKPRNSEFFDYKAKYTPGQSEEITPAPISEADTLRIQQIARDAFNALGCRDLARIDFILTAEGPFILEANTIPGLTPTSLLPQAAAVDGIEFGELLGRLIENHLRG